MNGRRYPDLRYKFIRGLITYEKYQRSKHFLKQAAEWTSKAVVSLDLTEETIKSVNQAAQLEAIGNTLKQRLKEIQKTGLVNPDPPQHGRFCSAGAAILATLYIAKQYTLSNHTGDNKETLVPENTLRTIAPQICEETFIDSDATVKGAGGALCPAWWRLTVLIARGLVKKRSVRKQNVYELLEAGEEIARRLVAQADVAQIMRLLPQKGGNIPDTKKPVQLNITIPLNYQESALYTNDDGGNGIILLIDIQEMGGDRVSLSQLIELVKGAGLRYRTQRLAVGDYCWVWRQTDHERPLPIVMERKRADDVARSIVDKRLPSQIEKMVSWKDRVLTDHITTPVCLTYLVEGNPADYVVRCADGCGGVTRCGYPNLNIVLEALNDIEEREELELVRSNDLHGTVDILTLMTDDLQRRVRRGEFQDFLEGPIISVTEKSYITGKVPKTRQICDINTKIIRKKTPLTGITHTNALPIRETDSSAPLAQFHHAATPQLPILDVTPRKSSDELVRGEIPMVRASFTPELHLVDPNSGKKRCDAGQMSGATGIKTDRSSSLKSCIETFSRTKTLPSSKTFPEPFDSGKCKEKIMLLGEVDYPPDRNGCEKAMTDGSFPRGGLANPRVSRKRHHTNTVIRDKFSEDAHSTFNKPEVSTVDGDKYRAIHKDKCSAVTECKYRTISDSSSDDDLPSILVKRRGLQNTASTSTVETTSLNSITRTMDNSTENEVDFSTERHLVSRVLPDVSQSQITKALGCCHGNVDMAVSLLCEEEELKENVKKTVPAFTIDLT